MTPYESGYCGLKISQACEVRPGIAFREAVRHIEGAPIRVAQAGDIGAEGSLDLGRMARVIEVETRTPPPLVGAGDVVIQARGSSFRAAAVPPLDFPLVAAASVLVLSPRQDLRPAFLAAFLNDPTTQNELRRISAGPTINHLRATSLGEIEMPLPSLAEQDAIVAFADAAREASRLEARLADLRRKQLRALFDKHLAAPTAHRPNGSPSKEPDARHD